MYLRNKSAGEKTKIQQKNMIFLVVFCKSLMLTSEKTRYSFRHRQALVGITTLARLI